MRIVKSAARSLEELCTYANSSKAWLDRESPPGELAFWEQLRELVITVAQEEFKWGKLPRITKYHILDSLIIDKFPDNVKHKKLIEMEEKVAAKLPKGRKVANLPGLCDVGRCSISFKTDLCNISETGDITIIDFMPLNLEELPWYSQSYMDAKYHLLCSYVPDLTYLIYSVAPANQLKIRQFLPQKTAKELYIALQFWHSGVVNRIVP